MIYSLKSPNSEKLDEMPDYETLNGVSRGICIPTTKIILSPIQTANILKKVGK